MEKNSEARIGYDGDHKYILALISDGKGSLYALASWDRPWHVNIASDYARMLQDEGKSLESILGGGRLVIDREAKSIRTYDVSGSYGQAPLGEVEKVLKENFPDYKITVE